MLVLPFFVFSVLAKSESWQVAYFDLLVRLRSHPGLIHSLISEKDAYGFRSNAIFYALNDYDQDGVPELIVYGNIPLTCDIFMDNCRVYTFKNGRVRKFRRAGDGNLWFLPHGFLNTRTNAVEWAFRLPEDDTDWTSNQLDFEAVYTLELDFDALKMEIKSIGLPPWFFDDSYYAEQPGGGAEVPSHIVDKWKTDNKKEIAEWQDTHELVIERDEYGRLVNDNDGKLWEQLLAVGENLPMDAPVPSISPGTNVILLFANPFVELGGAALCILAVTVTGIVLLCRKIKKKKRFKEKVHENL